MSCELHIVSRVHRAGRAQRSGGAQPYCFDSLCRCGRAASAMRCFTCPAFRCGSAMVSCLTPGSLPRSSLRLSARGIGWVHACLAPLCHPPLLSLLLVDFSLEYLFFNQCSYASPKCRCAYPLSDQPRNYECFCGKVAGGHHAPTLTHRPAVRSVARAALVRGGVRARADTALWTFVQRALPSRWVLQIKSRR